MKSETLLDAIGMISDNAIADAKSNRRPMLHSWAKWRLWRLAFALWLA